MHSVEKCKDSGLALVLLSLIGFQVWKLPGFILLSIGFLLITMTYPRIFQPFAIFWFALSNALGRVVSSVILTVLFFALVLPIGYGRRLLGKDAMQLNRWKKGPDSVLRERNHRFMATDLDHPY